jgi:hypothetical protein
MGEGKERSRGLKNKETVGGAYDPVEIFTIIKSISNKLVK